MNDSGSLDANDPTVHAAIVTRLRKALRGDSPAAHPTRSAPGPRPRAVAPADLDDLVERLAAVEEELAALRAHAEQFDRDAQVVSQARDTWRVFTVARDLVTFRNAVGDFAYAPVDLCDDFIARADLDVRIVKRSELADFDEDVELPPGELPDDAIFLAGDVAGEEEIVCSLPRSLSTKLEDVLDAWAAKRPRAHVRSPAGKDRGGQTS